MLHDFVVILWYQQDGGNLKAVPLNNIDNSSEEDSDEGWFTKPRCK